MIIIRVVGVLIATALVFTLMHAHVTLPALTVVGLIALAGFTSYLAVAARKGASR